MEIFEDIVKIREFLDLKHKQGLSIGLVPTMGALHEGHLSLVRSSVQENVLTVCSVYVNPTQFNNPEDLKKYPKTREQDLRKLSETGCDVVWLPKDKEMYPDSAKITFNFGALEENMEGRFRKGHFNGVALVVAKLFNIIRPSVAYFGQKDLQQFVIIEQLARELRFDLNLKCLPTVREPDGLAMSSRNLRLNTEQRERAVIIYKALLAAKEALNKGETVGQATEQVNSLFNSQKEVALEYFEVVHKDNLEPVRDLKAPKKVALCIAGQVGKVRLIDNMFLY